jgi:hypothetical protein
MSDAISTSVDAASPQGEAEIDWVAADAVARQLGAHTRHLVAAGDSGPAIAWALQQSGANAGPRAVSYYELAMLLGHQRPQVEENARRDWHVLMERTQRLAATVKAKAAAEAAAVEAAAGAAKTRASAKAEPKVAKAETKTSDAKEAS